MVCYGEHERHADCEWVPLDGSVEITLPEGMTREAIQQGWRDYDAAMGPAVVHVAEPFEVSGEWIGDAFHPTGCTCGGHVDLYDKPIDLRPVPKPSVIDACIEHLRGHRDFYGVELLELAKVRGDVKEDAKDTERAR